VSMTEDVSPLSRRAVRAQLVVGLGGLPVLGDPVRDQGDRWPVLGFPGIWLALDIRSDAGVQVASLGVENWRPQVVPSSDPVPRSVPIDIPWPIAREIGQARAATRRLRVFRARAYWALEAQRNDTYLAEQRQIDLLLAEKAQLDELILKAASKAARL